MNILASHFLLDNLDGQDRLIMEDDAMSDLPVDPWFLFLKKNKLEKYWEPLMNEGYDDFDFFTNMTEEEVRKMAETVCMASGHTAKLINVWRTQKFGDTEQETSSVSMQSDVTMPERIKRLLAPHPTTEKISFYNMVTQNIFNANHACMTTPKLESYILSQRYMQYEIILQCKKVENVVNNCTDSGDRHVDGNFTNIQKFNKMSSVKKNDFGKLNNSIRFLQGKFEKANKLKETLILDRNKIITSGSADISSWRGLELQFFASQIKELNGHAQSIEKTINSFQRMLDRSNADKSYAAEAENSRLTLFVWRGVNLPHPV